MKSQIKIWLFLFVALVTGGGLISCSDDDDELTNGGKPMISYIRITRPDASDSLIVKASQGQMIAIMGQNLGQVREIWINDQKATLTPTLITNTSIITRVPALLPTEISNKMRIVYGNGEVLEHPFTLDVSEPLISYLLSEYVSAGSIATIRGNYFYAPVKVIFAGGVEGEIEELADDMIQVKVPEGAQPGPITVTSNFGTTESDFWFRDNRNIIASFDGTTNGLWHGPDYIKSTDSDIQAINGKFIRFNKKLGANPWAEFYVGPNNSDVALETKNLPADALANPSKYNLKFEINTLAPLAGAEMRMYIGAGDMSNERNNNYYNWKPNVNTKGEWQTVVIPFEEFYVANKKFAYSPTGYGVSFWFNGPTAVETNFAIDNLRVVPNVIP